MMKRGTFVCAAVLAVASFAEAAIFAPTADYNMANRSYCGISSVAVSPSGGRLWGRDGV